METKEQEAKEAWRKHSIDKAKYEYAKAHYQSEENANYIQAVSANSRTYAISDFQTALIEVLNELSNEVDNRPITKKTDGYEDGVNLGLLAGLQKAISLVKTVTPKKK